MRGGTGESAVQGARSSSCQCATTVQAEARMSMPSSLSQLQAGGVEGGAAPARAEKPSGCISGGEDRLLEEAIALAEGWKFVL